MVTNLNPNRNSENRMQELFGGIYNGKRVFLTGHTGFKGSWLAAWLRQMGAHVTGYALAPDSQPALFPLLGLDMPSHIADIRHPHTLEPALLTAQPEVVFHLAAQPLVRLSYAEPVNTFETNVMGTLRVLEAARRCPTVKAIVVVTSDKCYQNNEWEWGYRENDAMGGHDPYSASKGATEILAASYRNSYFSPHAHPDYRHPALLATVRAGNVIGGGDWALDRIVPDAARAAASRQPLQIRNPRATRPWQHVLEPLSGYLAIGQKLLEGNAHFAEGWNFGPEDTSTVDVETIILGLQRHWPALNYQPAPPAPALHEAKLLKLDTSKAWHYLRWRPVWNLDETLRHTAQWYRGFHEAGTCAHSLTQTDLAAYTTKARQLGLPWAI